MVDSRAERIGLNEAVFREVNERIEELAGTFGLLDQPLDLVCECGNLTCAEQIHLAPRDYEALRADPSLFAIFPGHEIPDVEDVVEKRGAYDVVRKHEGGPSRVAEETDPRS